jgi:hypothetical protein
MTTCNIVYTAGINDGMHFKLTQHPCHLLQQQSCCNCSGILYVKAMVFVLYSLFAFCVGASIANGQFDAVENKKANSCTGGKWVEHDHIPLINQHILHINRTYSTFKSPFDILTEVCQAETLYHNCIYQGMTNRTNKILKRSWHTNESDCHSYHPNTFAENLRNQQLHFIGDSTMLQTWKYLTCSLLSVTTSNESNIQWFHYRGSSNEVSNIYTDKTCPLGAPHCLIHQHGYIYFNEYNLNLSYVSIIGYAPLELQRIIKLFNMTANDIVILNFGLHFNVEKQFSDTVKQFLTDYHNKLKTPVKPKLLFQETMPQHFTRMTAKNGYYNKFEAATYCDPIGNLTGDIMIFLKYWFVFILYNIIISWTSD